MIYKCKNGKKYTTMRTGWTSFCGGGILSMSETPKAPDPHDDLVYARLSLICNSVLKDNIASRGFILVYEDTHKILVANAYPTVLLKYRYIKYTIGDRITYVWMDRNNIQAYGKNNMCIKDEHYPVLDKTKAVAAATLDKLNNQQKALQDRHVADFIKTLRHSNTGVYTIGEYDPQHINVYQPTRLVGLISTVDEEARNTGTYVCGGLFTALPPLDYVDQTPVFSMLTSIGPNVMSLKSMTKGLGRYDAGIKLTPLAEHVTDYDSLFNSTLMSIANILSTEPAEKLVAQPGYTHDARCAINKTVWLSDNLLDVFRVSSRPLDTGGVMAMILDKNKAGTYGQMLPNGVRVYYRVIPFISGNPVHSGRATSIAIISLNPIKEDVS